jgi:hypothetical protein
VLNGGSLLSNSGLQLLICGLKLPNSGGLLLDSGGLFLDGGLNRCELHEKDGKVEGEVGDVGSHVAAWATEATSHLPVRLGEASAQFKKGTRKFY